LQRPRLCYGAKCNAKGALGQAFRGQLVSTVMLAEWASNGTFP